MTLDHPDSSVSRAGPPVAERAPRDLTGPVLALDLAAEADLLRRESPWDLHGRNAVTLVKHSDLRIVLMLLKAKSKLEEHHAGARIAIQTVSGHARVHLKDRTVELPAGSLLALERDVLHDLEAVEESAVLLTIAWQGTPSQHESVMANATAVPATEREHYLATFEREYQTTLRQLRAYPASRSTWKPSDSSRTAAELAQMLTLSQQVTVPIVKAARLEPPTLAPPSSDWASLVADFEQAHHEASPQLAAMTDSIYQATLTMPVGAGGATAPVRRADALWMMLFDTVHHRGQLSVYLRAVGGKVPAIYGPSADEPW